MISSKNHLNETKRKMKKNRYIQLALYMKMLEQQTVISSENHLHEQLKLKVKKKGGGCGGLDIIYMAYIVHENIGTINSSWF